MPNQHQIASLCLRQHETPRPESEPDELAGDAAVGAVASPWPHVRVLGHLGRTPPRPPRTPPTPRRAPTPRRTTPFAALEQQYRRAARRVRGSDRIGRQHRVLPRGRPVRVLLDVQDSCRGSGPPATTRCPTWTPWSSITKADVDSISPITQTAHRHRHDHARPVRRGVRYSDGTAGNLLMRDIGGPAALTAYLRGLGDTASRMDDYEPALNENRPATRATPPPRAPSRAPTGTSCSATR